MDAFIWAVLIIAAIIIIPIVLIFGYIVFRILILVVPPILLIIGGIAVSGIVGGILIVIGLFWGLIAYEDLFD